MTGRAHCESGSPGQTSNRVQDGLGECIHLSTLQSPVEHLTNISTSPTKLHVFLMVSHRILDGSESKVRFFEG